MMSQSGRGMKMALSLRRAFYGSFRSSVLHLVLMPEEEIWAAWVHRRRRCRCFWGCKKEQDVFMNVFK